MQMPRLARWTRAAMIGALVGLAGCVVRVTPRVNPGYGATYAGPPGAGIAVGPQPPAYASGMPPQPLYEQMSVSPGNGSVWIDGHWHWNSYEWVWIQGRWERDQTGFVYVEPSYDYAEQRYVYTPGYWSQPARVPSGWNVRGSRDGRPTIVAPPIHSRRARPPVGRPAPLAPPVGRGAPLAPAPRR